MCLEHMRKITGNNAHAHDDLADTLEMSCRAVFIDESLLPYTNKDSTILTQLSGQVNTLARLRQRAS